MNDSRRFRSDRPNPLRYQGSLQHYHVSPPRQNISWEQWVGDKSSRSRIWSWIMSVGIFAVAITAVVAALWR